MLSPGSRIGAYEIVSSLGAGGMGEVYRARDARLGRDVAIKVLPDAFTAEAERVARFEREAQLLAALNHVGASPDLAVFGPPASPQPPGAPWTGRILLKAPAADTGGEVSPDGRYIVYQSNESSRNEIYVRPYPELSSGRWQVSTESSSTGSRS